MRRLARCCRRLPVSLGPFGCEQLLPCCFLICPSTRHSGLGDGGGVVLWLPDPLPCRGPLLRLPARRTPRTCTFAHSHAYLSWTLPYAGFDARDRGVTPLRWMGHFHGAPSQVPP
jgi:hypothetical protein